jgi:hypothetical protein
LSDPRFSDQQNFSVDLGGPVKFITPQYASTEFASSKIPTKNSDVHALGITMYELLTGKDINDLIADVHGDKLKLREKIVDEIKLLAQQNSKNISFESLADIIDICLDEDLKTRPKDAGDVFWKLSSRRESAGLGPLKRR